MLQPGIEINQSLYPGLLADFFALCKEHDRKNQPAEAKMPFHFFSDLADLSEPHVTTSELKAIHFFHRHCELCLSLLRRKELALGEVVLARLTNFGITFPALVNHGMHAFYYGVASYKAYISGNYHTAIALLEKGIAAAKEQSVHLPVFLFVAYEQWYNKIRVYLKLDDLPSCITACTRLYQFGLTVTTDDGKYLSGLQHSLASVVTRTLAEVEKVAGKNIQAATFNLQLFQALSDVIEPVPPYYKAFNTMVAALHSYYAGNHGAFLGTITMQHHIFQRAPEPLRKLAMAAAERIAATLASAQADAKIKEKN